jgi:beta-glucuronidase
MRKTFITSILSILFVTGMYAQEFKVANPQDIALFPQQNDFRNVLNLSGIWKFKLDTQGVGEKEQWFNGLKDYRSIAVPGSWNEQFTDTRDYLDLAWYETETYVPSAWRGQRIYIRIGSATYAAKVWINGAPLGQHEGGHIPFAFDISSNIKWDATNRVTIQIENILKPTRVPTGNVQGSSFRNFPESNYDFFPYAGLNRQVHLYTVPTNYIKDITVRTDFQSTTGKIEVKVEQEGKIPSAKVTVSGNGQNYETTVKFANGVGTATISIPNVRLWSPEDPHLYEVSVNLGEGKVVDRYTLKSGIRTIAVNEKQLLLNGKPIFLKGFGKHEDFPIFGRGSAYPVIVKDFSLFKWIGANSFRTTHYPYDEEFLHMADREGILIIDEIPAVGLYFDGDVGELNQRQATCRQYINELYSRDKNHTSVVMWCVANEPSKSIKIGIQSESEEDDKSFDYMSELFKMFRDKDPTRLVTFVGVMMGPANWHTLSDVVCINRYWGWYTNTGDIEAGFKTISSELDRMHKKYKRPVMVTEFGADASAGTHAYNDDMYTEEFQQKFIKGYLDVADSKDFMAGMHIWNFADFKTSQNLMRFGGYNLKGVFTRDRKPKMAAHYLRSRWNKEAASEK